MTTAHYAHRPALRRNSPISILAHSHGFAADAPMMQRIDVGDSSDDEIPQPMKFSALTKALLESDAPGPLSPKHDPRREEEDLNGTTKGRDFAPADIDTPVRAPLLKIVRKPSPHLTRSTAVGGDSRNASPRILHISRSGDSAKRSTASQAPLTSRSFSRETTPASSYVTPGPTSRSTFARARAGSNASLDEVGRSISRSHQRAGAQSGESDDDVRGAFARSGSAASGSDAATKHTQAVLNRSRFGASDHTMAGTTRKRVAVGTGSFLKGAPVRRGFRRRESDDQPSPNEEMASFVAPETSHDHEQQQQAEFNDREKHQTPPTGTEQSRPEHRQASRAASRASVEHPAPSQQYLSRPASRKASSESLNKGYSVEQPSRRIDSAQSQNVAACRIARKASVESLKTESHADPQHARRPSVTHASYKAPPLRVHDAASDQENMPPPTFKRNKDSDFKIMGHSKTDMLSAKILNAETPVHAPTRQQGSPRRALGQLSANTPQRTAPPPPPKMTVLDAATKAAGASATKTKKKRSHVVMNGKLFTTLGRLGKGGSSDVYSVMAENHKLFALKRVKLSDCDEAAVAGYKGEIDLLQKLSDVERVVALYDWELDESRGILSLLMERGEGDLNRVLTNALSAEGPRLDTVFIRWWWREMLSCVDAVHEHDIVHSDLKPANFLVVGGRLKLIDFGIANAIDTDNTMNVHRDSNVGTPNYMSPESITDTNAPMPGQARSDTAAGRMMKLGKPSDVWSLGCILYQMVYGRPPFAHIANHISRVMAITNHRVAIDFPATGLGGVPVPPELKGVLRRCLQRDPRPRPTVKQLLATSDAWLYPDAAGRVALTDDLLAVIILRVAERCAKGDEPDDAEVRGWARGFLARVRDLAEGEGVVGFEAASAAG